MTSKSKTKGNTFEREIVKIFKAFGYDAKRAYASNGLSLGHAEDVDVVVSLPSGQFDREYPLSEYYEDFKIQCKRRKKLPNFLGLSDTNDAVIFRQDQDKPYIMLSLESFIKYLR